MTKNRHDEAKQIILHIAKENRIDFDMEIIDKIVQTNDKSNDSANPSADATIMDIFKSPNLRKKAFIIFFNWFINSGK